MTKILFIVLIGSLISLTGTMIGASFGVMLRKPSDRILGALIGFAGGVMLSVVVFDLIPESIQSWSLNGTLLFTSLGISTIAIFDYYIGSKKFSYDKKLKVAFMAGLGMMVHNLPEGVIMGCGFVSSSTMGIKMSLIIALHDIPEGIAVSAPMIASQMGIIKTLFYTLFTALPTVAGVWIGAYIGGISENILAACMAYASGIMLYVVCGEMLPESSKLWGGITSTLGILFGVVLGLIMTRVI